MDTPSDDAAVPLGSFVVGVDATVVNVALPAIEEDLGGGLAGQQWVVNAYLLFLGSLILIGGSLGDVFGERRVFRIGVSGFGAGLRAVRRRADDRGARRRARAAGRVRRAADAGRAGDHRGRPSRSASAAAAMGAWTAWSGIGDGRRPARGRPARGQLLVAADLRGQRAVRARRRSPCRRASRPAAAGCRARVGRGRRRAGRARPDGADVRPHRAAPPGVGRPGGLGPAGRRRRLFAAFLRGSGGHRSRCCRCGCSGVRNFARGQPRDAAHVRRARRVFFLLAIFLQQVAGYDALQAGLATLPATIVMFLLSRRFGALADRYGPRLFMGFGPLVAAAGLAALAARGRRRRLRRPTCCRRSASSRSGCR